jgi:hypothetical protein
MRRLAALLPFAWLAIAAANAAPGAALLRVRFVDFYR